MAHGMSTLTQGLRFVGLSAQRKPDNPADISETQRLLSQFSARPFRPSSSNSNRRQNSATPRSTPQPNLPPPSSSLPSTPSSSRPSSRQSSQARQTSARQTPQAPQRHQSHQPQPAPSSSGRPSHIPSQSESRDSRTAPSPRAQVPLHFVSPSPILSSPQHVSTGRDIRQRTLRESIAITNVNRHDETLNQITLGALSETSSRSISPEQSSIRRSGRSRAQPTNYYARIHIGSEEPGSTQEARTVVSSKTIPPQEPTGIPPRRNMRNFLCGRELGGIPIDTEIMSDLKTWKSWKGASGDISAVTWSPNGIQFVAGALSKSDQYNRRNNLILGDIQSSCLKEIPDHYIPRPAEETLTMDDPYLFTSVSDVKWVGDRLYTSSFDQTVKIWDATYANISCVQTLKHESKVDVTAVSSFDSGILATGTTSVVVWDARDLENPTPTTLYLDRDTRYRPNVNFTSTALAWGHMPFTKEFLLGGMSGQDGDEQSYKGHLGLWRAREASFETMKVSTNTQNINDLKWHSSLPQFATASPEDPHNARSKGIGTTTKSIVRIFSLDCNLSKRIPSIMEFSCPALDANEITFCPTDGRYITASCTDGATYVWDNRKGDRILHELRHGDPISPIDHDRTREVADVGVRVALWGTAGQFYTGGSDGVLKRWDVRRSTEDALLQNIASFQHEIYSASFSPDQSHLLVGDSGGAVHVLSSGPCADPDIKEFIFEHAPNPSSSNETDEPNERTALNGISTVSTHEEIPQSTFLSVEPAPSRSEKKRRREERRRIKAGQLPAEDLETNGAHREDTVMDTANGKDPDESDGEQLARKLQAERKKKRRHKKRRLLKMMPIISNTESIDLTMDSDSEQRHFQLEQLREALEDDNWFPPSGQIDPNFTTETV